MNLVGPENNFLNFPFWARDPGRGSGDRITRFNDPLHKSGTNDHYVSHRYRKAKEDKNLAILIRIEPTSPGIEIDAKPASRICCMIERFSNRPDEQQRVLRNYAGDVVTQTGDAYNFYLQFIKSGSSNWRDRSKPD